MTSTKDLLTTIGLEIHVELKTATKMFCSCPVAFGGDPNTRTCPICLGHPGTLPVPNEKAIEYTMKIALALGCRVAPHSIFHRKNYFYPDMPKNYQISQYDIPIGSDGSLTVEVDGQQHTVGITRVHLEEDTGKSIHVGGGGRIHDAEYSLEDFNRAGTPLVEIVTEPDIRSAEVASQFASELRSILEHLGVSDVRMEEGSMRIDANISVAPAGQKGTKAEIKNMNSIRSVQRALSYEQERQKELLLGGGSLEQSTRHWDEKEGVTHPMRTKEFAFDYRYFPEPDLVPIEPDVEWLRQLSEELPDPPSELRRRLVDDAGLTKTDATVIVSTVGLIDYFESARAASRSATPKQIANWIANELTGLTSDASKIASSNVTPQMLAELVDTVVSGKVSKNQGKAVLAEMLSTGRSPDQIISEQGMEQVSDEAELAGIVEEVLAENADASAKVRAGDDKPLGFLVGMVMKRTQGRANPGVVNELLRAKLR